LNIQIQFYRQLKYQKRATYIDAALLTVLSI